MYCVHARKRASWTPRTHFSACKISNFLGRAPDPLTQSILWGPTFCLCPGPPQSFRRPCLPCWGTGDQTIGNGVKQRKLFSIQVLWWIDTFSVVLFVISNSEMSTKMYPRMCLRMVNRWERGWFPAKVIRYWHMGVVHCNAYSVWFLWSGLVTQPPKCGLLYIAKKSNFVLSAAAVWSHGHMQLATNVSSTNWSSYIAALQNGHTTASDPLVWEWC